MSRPSCPYSPKKRKPIHSVKMGENSGKCTQSPSSSHRSMYPKEGGLTYLPYTDGKDDNGCSTDSDTDDSQSIKKPEHTKENTASLYCNSSIFTKIIKQLQKYYDILRHNKMTFIAVAVAVVVALALAYLFLPSTQDTEKVNKMSLKVAIELIREEFPSQLAHIWEEFSAGINETAQGTPTKPSVFMLLYETEEGTAICLAQKVGNMSTHLLDAEKSNPLLIIDGADLEHNETLAEDYGTLLDEYRPKVEEQRAMIINNLHKIPGTVAQSFHSFCDTVSPTVGKAVYLFTMKASGVSNRHNPTEVAEEELRKLWSDELDEDRLNPLITRITDMTMMIMPEKNLAPC